MSLLHFIAIVESSFTHNVELSRHFGHIVKELRLYFERINLESFEAQNPKN